MSRQRFFRLYGLCCGMTGTARGCEDEFKRFFGIKVKAVPLHKESKRVLLPIRFFETREAAMVAVAGKRGAVTVATDMADRGTDISIDKDVKQLARISHQAAMDAC